MNEIDRVFRVTFARWRRKLGDSNLESAWRRASNSMSGFILFPTAAIVIPLSLFVMAMTQRGYSPAVKQTIQIVGVLVWFSISFLLERRFRALCGGRAKHQWIVRRKSMERRYRVIAEADSRSCGRTNLHAPRPSQAE
jgi:hypothetical protein